MRFWLAKWRFIIMCTSDATFSLSAFSYQLYYLTLTSKNRIDYN